MKIVITGSRSITDYALVAQWIESSGFDITEVAHGGSDEGVDACAKRWAEEHGVPTVGFHVTEEEWAKHGPEHRAEMIDAYQPNGVIVLWDGTSPGTRALLRRAAEHLIWAHVFVAAKPPE